MHLRRPFALACGALLLAPVLGACGFDYPTDRVNDVTHTGTNRDVPLNVVGAVVVSTAPGSGTLVAQLTNTTTEEASVTAITGADGVEVGDLEDGDVPALAALNLGSPTALTAAPGVQLTGDFSAGSVLDLDFDVTYTDASSGEETTDTVTVSVPVVTDCHQYEGWAEEPSDAPAVEEAAELEGGAVDPYSCEYPELESEH